MKIQIGISGYRIWQIRINRKRKLEKFVDLCVVNKTCISLTTVTEMNTFLNKIGIRSQRNGQSIDVVRRFHEDVCMVQAPQLANTPDSSSKQAAQAEPKGSLRLLSAGDGHK